MSPQISLLVFFLCIACRYVPAAQPGTSQWQAQDLVINNWHQAAATGDSAAFFGAMWEDCLYLGTDETERWTRAAMAADLGKYFNGKKAWHFIPYNRHYLPGSGRNSVLFDECLQTWMGPCRGSGRLVKKKNRWLIAYYQLSVAVPNTVVNEYIKLLPTDKVLKK